MTDSPTPRPSAAMRDGFTAFLLFVKAVGPITVAIISIGVLATMISTLRGLPERVTAREEADRQLTTAVVNLQNELVNLRIEVRQSNCLAQAQATRTDYRTCLPRETK